MKMTQSMRLIWNWNITVIEKVILLKRFHLWSLLWVITSIPCRIIILVFFSPSWTPENSSPLCLQPRPRQRWATAGSPRPSGWGSAAPAPAPGPASRWAATILGTASTRATTRATTSRWSTLRPAQPTRPFRTDSGIRYARALLVVDAAVRWPRDCFFF